MVVSSTVWEPSVLTISEDGISIWKCGKAVAGTKRIVRRDITIKLLITNLLLIVPSWDFPDDMWFEASLLGIYDGKLPVIFFCVKISMIPLKIRCTNLFQ